MRFRTIPWYVSAELTGCMQNSWDGATSNVLQGEKGGGGHASTDSLNSKRSGGGEGLNANHRRLNNWNLQKMHLENGNVPPQQQNFAWLISTLHRQMPPNIQLSWIKILQSKTKAVVWR